MTTGETNSASLGQINEPIDHGLITCSRASRGTLSPRFKQQACLRDLAAISARVLSEVNLFFRRRGAGKTGSLPPPWPPCGEECTGQEPQVRPGHPGLPCATVLRVIGALPGDRLSCPRHQRIIITTGLASAPRCQDHTISPSPRSVRRRGLLTPGCRATRPSPPRLDAS